VVLPWHMAVVCTVWTDHHMEVEVVLEVHMVHHLEVLMDLTEDSMEGMEVEEVWSVLTQQKQAENPSDRTCPLVSSMKELRLMKTR